MEDTLAKVNFEVVSTHNPDTILLGQARQRVQNSKVLQEAFKDFQQKKITDASLLDKCLTDCAESTYSDEEKEVVFRYLIDEFNQADGSILILDNSTNRAIAKVKVEDLWQPPQRTRESGKLVTPGLMVRPDILAALTMNLHETKREENLLSLYKPITELLATDGDIKLQPLTRAGRRTISQVVEEMLPSVFQNYTKGGVGAFLKSLHLSETKDPHTNPVKAFTKITLPIQDLRSLNLRYDRTLHILNSAVAGWVREIASNIPLGKQIYRADPLVREVAVWIAGPEQCKVLRTLSAAPTIVVQKPVAIGLMPSSGILHAHNYECHSREVHDRWEIGCELSYTLTLHEGSLVYLDLVDLAPTGIVVEVVL